MYQLGIGGINKMKMKKKKKMKTKAKITFFFCSKIIILSFNGWHMIRANILPIVNVILTDGIRMFLNTLTKKNRSQLQNNNFFLWWNV